MIHILVVEDNPNKQKKIKELIDNSINILNSNVDYANDIKTAKSFLYKKSYDFLILDLVLPLDSDGDPSARNGLNFLDELHSSPQIKTVTHIVGLTEFSQNFEEYKEEFSKHLWHLISYKADETDWQHKLKNILFHLIKTRQDFLKKPIVDFDYDVAIITALQKPELEQILKLKGDWEEIFVDNDATRYSSGVFQREHKRVRVIAASSPQMGMVAASCLTMKLMINFRPKYIIMAGILAGVKGEVNYGDIIVADQTYDGTSGKIVDIDGQRNFSPNPTPLSLDADLKEKIRLYETKDQYFFNLKKEWNGNTPPTDLKLKVGPIVSVPYVVQNENELEQIKLHQRKLLGLEMEGFGVFYSALNGINPKPKPIIIKSVCDFGDKFKGDNYQNYAAFTSARFIYDFILNELF